MSETTAYRNLHPEALLHIASYLHDKLGILQERLGINVEEPYDSDEDLSPTYSDIDEESRDDDFDPDDYMALDGWYERRYARHCERRSRDYQYGMKIKEKRNLARARKEKMDEKVSRAKKKASILLTLTGTCKSWRELLCSARKSDTDTLIWKPLLFQVFHEIESIEIRHLDKSYFSLFLIMVITSNRQKDEAYPCGDQRRNILEGIDLQQAMFVVRFIYDGKYETLRYSSVSMAAEDYTVRMYLPRFTKLCNDVKILKWKKEARGQVKDDSSVASCTFENSDRSLIDSCYPETNIQDLEDSSVESYTFQKSDISLDNCCYPEADVQDEDDSSVDTNTFINSLKSPNDSCYPVADIYIVLHTPGINNLKIFKIYHGRPIWKVFGDDFDLKNTGPIDDGGTVCANLNHNFLLIDDKKLIFSYEEREAYYTEYQKGQDEEYWNEYGDEEEHWNDNDDEVTQFRRKDLKNFLINA